MSERTLWQSPCEPGETVADAAARFVKAFVGYDCRVSWGTGVGEFWFDDGAWRYRIACEGGHWSVCRTGEMSPRGKAYSEARRESRRGEDATDAR